VASITGSGAYGPLNYFFVALAVAAFVVEAWAFVDAIIRPTQAFRAVGKLSKPIWLIILGVAFVVGLYAAAYGGAVGFLSVAAFVAAAIYLADVRPKVREFGRGRSSSSGPYGPW
jgi:O-antigen/teichoic acid export membrane protein